jgi:dipeptidyl aminopeptidase/acylaminoacyl peptidase
MLPKRVRRNHGPAFIDPGDTAYLEAIRSQILKAVGDPHTEEGLSLLRERSLLFQAGRIAKPLLIAQGANVPRVKQAEADQMVKALREKGIPVAYPLPR